MKKLLLLAFLITSALQVSHSQHYKNALGFRSGAPVYGSYFGLLNFKHFFGNSVAIDLSAGGRRNYLYLEGLFEKHKNIQSTFDWYWGLGGDVGLYQGNYYYYDKNDNYYSGAGFGVSGVLGIEYTFEEVPINLALHAGPRVGFNQYNLFTINSAFSIRYVFGR